MTEQGIDSKDEKSVAHVENGNQGRLITWDVPPRFCDWPHLTAHVWCSLHRKLIRGLGTCPPVPPASYCRCETNPGVLGCNQLSSVYRGNPQHDGFACFCVLIHPPALPCACMERLKQGVKRESVPTYCLPDQEEAAALAKPHHPLTAMTKASSEAPPSPASAHRATKETAGKPVEPPAKRGEQENVCCTGCF